MMHPTDTSRPKTHVSAKPQKDIIRCLRRFVARDAYQRVVTDHRHRQPAPQTNT